jgi:hypothetical protein
MEAYSKIYESYCSLVHKCCSTSQKWAGVPSISDRHFYASLLFTRLCTISVSVKNLAPSEVGNNDHWDYGSIAALTRSLIETYLTFFYLCIENCSSEEWHARKQLMNLHDHMSRKKMFAAVEEEYEINEEAKEIKEEIITKLKNNSWFQSLSEKQQKAFLKGKTAFFKNKDEIVSSYNENIGKFRLRYTFLSNNTHSYPMGFYRMKNGERGRGIESRIEIKYTAICLQWLSGYLERAEQEFDSLFSGSN